MGPEGGAAASGQTQVEPGDDAPLNLSEDWVADEEQADPADWADYEEPKRSWGWLVPTFALLTVAIWTGYFGWAQQQAFLIGAAPWDWTALIAQWSMPVLLVVGLWLLAMRTSRREMTRFSDASRSLAHESAALEARLVTINRELSLAREFLASQTRELETLGRVATARLSENAEQLQSLIANNGEQVEAIAKVSEAATENMDRLRGDLPVIANSARDVSNQIGAAGNTAKDQLETLVAGFERLNEFGQASGRQVSALQAKVDETIAAFSAQLSQMEEASSARFIALRESSEAFRTELDGREVDALAAMRHRADKLREEVAAATADLEAREEELLASLRARISAVREGAATVSHSLAEGEDSAASKWGERISGLQDNLADAIEAIGQAERESLESANARLDAVRTATEQSLAELTGKLAEFDAGLEERTAAQLARAQDIEDHGRTLGERIDALGSQMSDAASQGHEAQTALAAALDALAARLTSSREALGETDRTVSDLTDASVRLLELIQASVKHSQGELADAMGSSEERLTELTRRGESLGLMLDSAGEKSRELSEYVLAAQNDSAAAREEVAAFHAQLATTTNGHAEQLQSLKAQLAALASDSAQASASAQGSLREAITALETSAREAIASLEDTSSERLRAIADRIGADAAAAIGTAVREQSSDAVSEVEEAVARAARAGRETAIQLRDQLARVNELAGNLESRVALARERAEEQVDNDFSRRVALITESLNSHAIDISRAISADVSDSAWASYLKGDRGIFTRRAVRLLDNADAREIATTYENDDDFRAHVSRYIHDFEAMLRTMLSTRDGHAIGVTLLSSDMGKLYVALAQAIERLRD
ncbi:ATPase [Tsuneonella mangrovi]|uniref:ATPase n=1 Tax=Tsuneonella mangrovi TaxID=1982042 RepID=UPI000BA27A0D|nr:ATPase [Tsuneonella mangrovi]